MLKFKKKLKDKIFARIRRIYEEEIVTYDLTIENMSRYLTARINILTIFEALRINKRDIHRHLGEEFTEWFFETHVEILNKFWEGEL